MEEVPQKQIESLLRPFPQNEIKALVKAGKSFDYVEANAVIDRLNEAFTPLGWSSDTSRIEWMPSTGSNSERDRSQPDRPIYNQLAVYCILKIYTPWGIVEKTGWGSVSVKAMSSDKMEFGDDLKSASSDALKKAATQLGLANYLSRKEPNIASDKVKELVSKCKEVYTKLGWSSDQFVSFASGIARKTILGPGDLTVMQATVCLEQLQSYESRIPNMIVN